MNIYRNGYTLELLRRLVGHYPFERGSTRLSAELGRVFSQKRYDWVIGGAGVDGVLFPYRANDLTNPGYWYLYERNIRRTIKQHLSQGDIFVDIGAHCGFHAAYALGLVGLDGCVIACEPHPLLAENLKHLATLNPDKQLRVHQVAMAESDGEATLLISMGWDTIHTIVPEFNDIFNAPRTKLQVRTINLDQLLSQYVELGLHNSHRKIVIKIDAEGSELSILKGASNALRSTSVHALIVECTGGASMWMQRSLECIHLLNEAGRQVEVLTTRGKRPWQHEDATRQVNILATWAQS